MSEEKPNQNHDVLTLDLSVRAEAIVYDYLGIRTIGQLIMLSTKNFQWVPHCGKKIISEIEDRLQVFGFSLAKNEDGLPKEFMRQISFANWCEWHDKQKAKDERVKQIEQIWKNYEQHKH